MCVLATGREGTASQFDQLFLHSGLVVESRVRLVTGFTAFVLAAASG
jgi:hypothetical protein